MIEIIENDRGRRRVALRFDESVKEQRNRKINGVKVAYEYFPSLSRTKPEFQKDMNINRIMAKFRKTKAIDPLIMRDMKYGDFANGSDFSEMAMKVADANFDFMQLPAELRSRFANDPAKLLDFVADKANLDEAVKLGIVEAPPAPPVVPAPSAPVPPGGVKPPVVVPPVVPPAAPRPS